MPLAEEAVARAAPTPRRRPWPVAIHLAVFAGGILIPVLLIVGFMLIDTARLWREELLHDARVIAQHLNATIEVELQKAIAVGQTLAATLVLDPGNLARFDAEARDVKKRLGVNIVTRDLSGQQPRLRPSFSDAMRQSGRSEDRRIR